MLDHDPTHRRPLAASRSEQGASAVEYGLLIAGIAALVVVIVFAFGGNLKGIFVSTCSKVSASTTSAGNCK